MPSDGDRPHRLRWLILGALLIGTVTGTLGNSLVNVALPTIMDHYSVDVGTGIWVVTIYILLFAVSMPLFGRLGDMYGYKRAYLIGMAVFAVSSMLSPCLAPRSSASHSGTVPYSPLSWPLLQHSSLRAREAVRWVPGLSSTVRFTRPAPL